MADPILEAAVMAALAQPGQRVERLRLSDGRQVWLKRVEALTGRLRLQKGNPARAFAAERAGLKALAEAGVPVARCLAAGADWLVLEDAGPTLPGLPAEDPATLTAFAAAGRALGQLHGAGLVHGRPAVRDICWDGRTARFIDLERFRPGRRRRAWQAADVVMFLQTCLTLWPDDRHRLDAALRAYGETAPAGAMTRLRRLATLLMPLAWLATALRPLRPHSRELRAVPLTLARARAG